MKCYQKFLGLGSSMTNKLQTLHTHLWLPPTHPTYNLFGQLEIINNQTIFMTFYLCVAVGNAPVSGPKVGWKREGLGVGLTPLPRKKLYLLQKCTQGKTERTSSWKRKVLQVKHIWCCGETQDRPTFLQPWNTITIGTLAFRQVLTWKPQGKEKRGQPKQT